MPPFYDYFQSQPSWSASAGIYTPGKIIYLTGEYITSASKETGLSRDCQFNLIEELNFFKPNSIWEQLFFHCHYRLCNENQTLQADEFNLWPEVNFLENNAPLLFYVFIFLSALGKIKKFYTAHGIPHDVLTHTLEDLQIWIDYSYQQTGKYCLLNIGRNWLFNHFTGLIFALGRLQFNYSAYPYDYHVFRNTEGKYLVLSPDNALIRKDGQFDGVMGIYNPAFTAQYGEQDDFYFGNPVTKDGIILSERVYLKKTKWVKIVQKGDTVLTFHIPASGPMDFAECGRSFARACNFFSRYFPDKPFNTFSSESWLFDNQWQKLLPSASNISRLSRELYLTPLPNADDKQLRERVFGSRNAEILTACSKSSLQKTIVSHVTQGGHFRSGGALYFKETFSWGNPPYCALPISVLSCVKREWRDSR